jgi:hypothetical protein
VRLHHPIWIILALRLAPSDTLAAFAGESAQLPVDLDQSARKELRAKIQLEKRKELPVMADMLTPRFLDRRTINKAYPLVRNMVPGTTAARWTQFVRPHLASRSADWPRGVMTIQNTAGYILALFAFEVRADLHVSRIFYMDHIMVPNLPGRRTLWACAICAAERLAEMNCCAAIWAEFRAGAERTDEDLLTSLERSGYAPAGVRAFKKLEVKSARVADGRDGVTRPGRGLYDA